MWLEPRLPVSEIKLAQVSQVFTFAAADGVEVFFHLRGELVIDQLGQMPFEQLRNRKSRPRRHERVALLEDVLPRKDRIDDRGIGAGPANSHFFQRRVSAASLNRAGGCVVWLFGFQVLDSRAASPTVIAGSTVS